MKKIIHAAILLSIGLLCIGSECECPFTPVSEYEIWTVYPADGAIVFEPEVTLVWADRGREASDYSVYFGTTPGAFDTSWAYLRDSFFTITFLEPSTTYYWYIKGWYDKGATEEDESSETVSFTTADRFYTPGEIHNPTPDSGAIGVSINPSFAWEFYNPDLTPYDFNLYLGTTTAPPLQASGLSAPHHSLTSDTLDYTTLYYWRVEAYYGADTVTGPLWHFTTDYPAEADIFALFEIDAAQAPSGYHVMEEIRARFDTGLALITPIEPLQADSLLVEGVSLLWNGVDQNYSYTEWSMPFIENGQPVDIVVYGNINVPSLNANPAFPACTLGIISPESFETVSLGGFEVTWDGSECGGTVWLTLTSDIDDSTGVWKETDNDGVDTLTADDLTPLGGQTGSYNLTIIKQVEENIVAPGYRPESLVRMRAYNTMAQINISGQ